MIKSIFLLLLIVAPLSAHDGQQQNSFAAINLFETGRTLHYELFKLRKAVAAEPGIYPEAIQDIETALDNKLNLRDEAGVNVLVSNVRTLINRQEQNRWLAHNNWCFKYALGSQYGPRVATRKQLLYLLRPHDHDERTRLWIMHHLLHEQFQELANRLDDISGLHRIAVCNSIRAYASEACVNQLRAVSATAVQEALEDSDYNNAIATSPDWDIPILRDMCLDLAPLAIADMFNGSAIGCPNVVHDKIIHSSDRYIDPRLNRPTLNNAVIVDPIADRHLNLQRGYRELSLVDYVKAVACKKGKSKRITVDDVPFETDDLKESLTIDNERNWEPRPRTPGHVWQLGMTLMQDDQRFNRISSTKRAELLHILLEQSKDFNRKINLVAFLELYQAIDATSLQDLPHRTCSLQ